MKKIKRFGEDKVEKFFTGVGEILRETFLRQICTAANGMKRDDDPYYQRKSIFFIFNQNVSSPENKKTQTHKKKKE